MKSIILFFFFVFEAFSATLIACKNNGPLNRFIKFKLENGPKDLFFE
jgi:hypothetical protein